MSGCDDDLGGEAPCYAHLFDIDDADATGTDDVDGATLAQMTRDLLASVREQATRPGQRPAT